MVTRMTKFVVSIDGGGIRGIVATKVLCEVEKRIRKPVGEVFDLFVGSSIGAIIAAALALRTSKGKTTYCVEEVLGFFFKYGPSIFHKSLIRNIISVISGSRFSASNFEKALRHIFKDITMGEISQHFLVPSYDVRAQNTIMFRNWVDGHKRLKLVDILRAASAAPTIFTPKRMTIDGSRCLMIDSAIIANNPSVCGYAAIDYLYPGEEVYFLSLGVGSARHVVREVKDSLAFWAINAAPIFMDAGMEAVDYQMTRILGSDKYIRVTGPLQDASYDFTDASERNMHALQLDADRIIEHESDKIDKFVQAYQRASAAGSK
ncbi:hypothetical protein ANPL_03625 [Anaplasma platys]|uniref:PNPLA domain-containing protein n=2 Tax=Anaplasma platys TaxID=949 RepID=A0A858PYT8_9RICK|nr:hypothetical protein ANPL_03625 [Anaplasma platys]